MRSAYLRVRCVAKGVSPFHKDLVPSCFTICFPQSIIPAAGAVRVSLNLTSAYQRGQQHRPAGEDCFNKNAECLMQRASPLY